MDLLIAAILSLALVTDGGVKADDANPVRDQQAAFAALKTFGPKTRGDYIIRNGRIRDQIGEGLSLGASRTVLSDGRLLLDGCRVHSCTEKAAVIVSKAGRAEAAALIDFACPYQPDRRKRATKEPQVVCRKEDDPRLTIFLPRDNPMHELEAPLAAWASHVEEGKTLSYTVVLVR